MTRTAQAWKSLGWLALVITVVLPLASIAGGAASSPSPAATAQPVAEDPTTLKGWLPRAQKGEAKAQHQVGRLYEKGQGGVEKNLDTALTWYMKAAQQGYADSQYRVGVAYAFGVGGVDKDEAKAVEWMEKAAAGGNKRSQKVLARIYETGEFGVTPDEKKAKYWKEKVGPKK